MKFDMHCHTKEGSIDAHVDIETYIRKLIRAGFDGMLVTDHNSYKGYKKWKQEFSSLPEIKSFTVLKGIEYDTRDGGHIIAVLPDHVHCRLLELRGLSLKQLEKLVHGLGGILGPAHPYGSGFFALMNTNFGRKNREIIQKFDFIETFNACTHAAANAKARLLALKYQKPNFAGSDAHKADIIGTAFTTFDTEIRSNNDLINAVRNAVRTMADGTMLEGYQKKNIIKKNLGIAGYWLYNKIGAFFYLPARSRAAHKLEIVNPFHRV